MKERFNAYEKSIADFSNEVLVVCSSCKKKGTLKRLEKCFKTTCINCGYSKEHRDTLNSPYKELWLSIYLNDKKLWAYNLEHLEFIKNHISADLRERNLENISNKSIGSRLPKWMTSKKNRNDVLKAIEKLKHK
jgi:hypothetical protein